MRSILTGVSAALLVIVRARLIQRMLAEMNGEPTRVMFPRADLR